MSDLIQRGDAQVVDVSTFTPEQRERAAQIAQRIDINDSQAIIQYGVGAQSKISGFADTMLGEIRAKDSGYVGDVLTGLLMKIKEVDAGSLSGKGAIGGLFGNIAGAVRRFIARYEKLSVQIEKIIDELDKARMALLKDITLLDGLYEKNLD
ncbi:MAG TPA: toxic anion resistance protein, partial [Spirochaetia bacterium]